MRKIEINKKVEDTINLLNLEEIKNKKPIELSGGQQQRVSLGRALIREASVYLLDEPLSHLDAQERVSLRTSLQRIQRLKGLTFILVTHDQLEALAMSDRIIVLNEGRVQQIGTPGELYNNPANLFVADFIGEPPMNFIKGKLKFENNSYVQKCKNIEFSINNPKKVNLINYKNKETILGIRPQHIELSEKNIPESIKTNVFSYEYLGEKGLLVVDCGGEKLLIEVEHKKSFKIDETVFIKFNDNYVCIFMADTGKRIL